MNFELIPVEDSSTLLGRLGIVWLYLVRDLSWRVFLTAVFVIERVCGGSFRIANFCSFCFSETWFS